MTVPTGLGEPRGPWFVSPVTDPWAAAAAATDGPSGPDGPGRWRRRLLAASAVLALSVTSGGLAGGVVAGWENGPARLAAGLPSPSASASAGVPADLVAAAAQVLPGVVSVQISRGAMVSSGSGFAIDDHHHIITNDHILDGDSLPGTPLNGHQVSVVAPDGRRIVAEVVGRDPGSDIAVLRVSPSAGLRPLVLAQTGSTQVGEAVLAVGSPLGLSGTVTAGIVSALDREVRLGNGGRRTAVQTDASINPGNSGGPLVNADGEVIGVNTAIATLEGAGSIGIGFAIPIQRAEQAADEIIRRGG
ncbi:trypsin-like peptidase domain-containing protein [Solwaraspora sp. WMMD406]|uniref:S1C family serine protease n=1 Tax=Solwaraspora sp. WMMD406 TaxID=3016095 RepID=UPI002415BB52|nr:trypsin-like peptidase domain-containing protein [Solwaraspora sp. WMMD406]MDG4767276.1 trypsin-like peptidase domain-containing protein [Solwaraspora sp. WMMD406]